MPKARELSHEERHTVKLPRETGFSFPKISERVGCHHSTALKIYRNFEATNSIAKLLRNGRPKKFDEQGERVVCRTAKRLRFESLRDISTAVQIAYPNKNPSKSLVRKNSTEAWHQIFQKKAKTIWFFKKLKTQSCLAS